MDTCRTARRRNNRRSVAVAVPHQIQQYPAHDLRNVGSKDSAGAINFIRTDGGDFIMVNGKEFGGESARDQAVWRDAFYDLKRHDFFEQKSKEYFVLTTKGFRIADKL